MGTWGEGPFENDTALDWAAETGATLSAIRKAIEVICGTDPDAYIDADHGCECVAACQTLIELHQPVAPGLVGRLFGRKATDPPKHLELVRSSTQALDRLLGEKSELAELWREGKPNKWPESVLAMRNKLTAIQSKSDDT